MLREFSGRLRIFQTSARKIWRRIMKGNVHMKTIISPSISLPDAEKLNVLRLLDHLRQWHSLDDKRYCLVCGKIITGQQIQVASGTRGNGALRLSCPSDGCNSIPIDWMPLRMKSLLEWKCWQLKNTRLRHRHALITPECRTDGTKRTTVLRRSCGTSRRTSTATLEACPI